MLSLDASERYDLSEAGRLLFAGPGRIERWIRVEKAPATRSGSGWALPRAWVDAASGREATDEESVRRYWLGLLAPPPRKAVRPRRDRVHLPTDVLLEPSEASRRLCADEKRLARLAREGTLPALRVDGETRYDAALVDLLATGDRSAGDARRTEVLDWARYEYAVGLDEGAPPPTTETQPAPATVTATAPRAWTIPGDLDAAPALPSGPSEETSETKPVTESEAEPPPGKGGSRLIEAEGYETIDED